MTIGHSSFVVLLAGVSFLLLGLSLASESLQKLAANRIREILNRLSESGLMAVAIGTLLTLLMQSSGAVTATLVNLGTGRVLTLPQVMGVLIGSAIGAALTVQLISLHVSHAGLILFICGFGISFVTKKRKTRTLAEFVMALGLLFFGLELIRAGAQSFVHVEAMSIVLAYLKANWPLAFLTSFILTSFFHSSTATLGIVMGMAASGVMTLSEALIWIYGANIGTASVALLAAVRANYLGRQIAWANFLYRAASVCIFLPIAGFAVTHIESFAPTVSSQIAFIYMALNVVAASVFFPLRKAGVSIVEKMIQPREGEVEFGVRFLKRSSYESFAIGLAHAKREILEMGDIVYQMSELSIEVFRDENPELVEKIRSLDDRVDLLLQEIKLFLIRVSDLSPEGLDQTVIDVISFGSDLEAAADVIDHHLLSLAKKKRKVRLEFRSEAWRDIEKLHSGAVRATSLAVTFFQTQDIKIAGELNRLKHEMRDVEQQSRAAHIARLSQQEEPMGTSALFLETLSTYLQLIEMLSRHGQRSLKTAQSSEFNQA